MPNALRRLSFRIFAVAACLAMCAACSLSRPAPIKQSFLLHATRAGGAPAAAVPQTLRINRFDVAAPFNAKPLVYRLAETRFEPDYYNEFVANPAGMLTERATTWLREAGVFKNVIPMSSTLDHRFVLEAAGTELYGDFRDPGAPAAVLAMRFFLARDDARAEIVYDKTLTRRIAIASRTPEAVVTGLDQALDGVLRELEADLRRVVVASN